MDSLDLVPPDTGATLVIGAKLEMMVSQGDGRREAFFDWPERHGLSLEAWPPLDVEALARGCV